MYTSCIVRNGAAYISCNVKVGKGGPYHMIDAVGPIPVRETEEFRNALCKAILRGTPVVPESDPRAHVDPGLLKLAGVKSWAALYSKASNWEIWDRGGRYTLTRLRRLGRGWEEDPAQTIQLPPGTLAEDAAQRLVEMIQVATTEP